MMKPQSLQASHTLASLAKLVGGEVVGQGDAQINGVGVIQHAKQGEICFLDNKKYHKYLKETEASAVVLSSENLNDCQINAIVVDNPKLAFAEIVLHIFPVKRYPEGVHPSCVMGNNTKIDASVYIGPNCVIGDNVEIKANAQIGANVVIEDNCVIDNNVCLHPNVCLYTGVLVGENTEIHSGTVVGSDGFGFANHEGKWIKVPQVGGVKIGKDVNIGANCTIDRGAIEDTIIADGCILDNLVHIGHNVKVGDNTAIAAVSAIAGTANIGKNCLIGGGSLVNGHISLTDGTMCIGGSRVINSIKKPGQYASLIPAKEYSQWVKNIARFNKLDEMAQKVKTLENKLKNLEILKEDSE